MKPIYKKIIGMTIIVLMSAVNLLIVFSIIYALLGNESNGGEMAFNLVFGLVLFSFPLWYGIRLWKAGVSDTFIGAETPDREIIMLETKLSFRDYLMVIAKLTFTSPMVLYLCVIGISMIVGSIVNPDKVTPIMIVIIAVVLLLPFITYISVKRNYNSSKNLKETILYKFDSTRIYVFGETFNSTLTFQSLYKVKEFNNWLLLYTSKLVAIIIPKNNFKSTEDLEAVKSYLLNTSGVLKELKK